MKIVIDDREGTRIKKAQKEYSKDTVEVEHLEYGDYVFDDEVVFEYKKYTDFISSVVDGRVFNQAINQSAHYKYHFVIIEYIENHKIKKILPYWKDKHFYSSIARLNTYTTVILVPGGVKKCLRMMRIQAEKCLDDKPVIKEIRGKEDNSALNFLSSCVKGVSYKRAKLIVEELDLKSLKDLLQLEYDDLINIKGIGKYTAKNIIKDIKR